MTRTDPLPSLAADLDEIRAAAPLVGSPDPWIRLTCLLAGASESLASGGLPWALLDAAHREISDLRLDLGAEDWATADWSNPAIRDLALVADHHGELLRRTRLARDAKALTTLRRVG